MSEPKEFDAIYIKDVKIEKEETEFEKLAFEDEVKKEEITFEEEDFFYGDKKGSSAPIPDDSDPDDVSSDDDFETEDTLFTPIAFPETLHLSKSSDSGQFSEGCDEINEPSLKWRTKQPSQAPTLNLPFTGIQCNRRPVKQPIEYFRELLTEDILANLVIQSNLYALQCNINKPLQLTINELEQFIGIIFIMSIVKMSDSRMYWEKTYRYALVADAMSRQRFEDIKRNIHCNDNTTRPENCTDKLFKLRPFLDSMVEVVKKSVPKEHISVDEQIVPFKGRSGLKQYDSQKPKKWGYKIFLLCGTDGMVHNFEIFTGVTETCPGQPDIQASGNIVLRLLVNIPRNVGHKIYCDNWFTSIKLVTTLESQGIHYVGTVRSNQLPGNTLPDDADLKRIGRGSSVIQTATKDNIELRVVKWFDNRGISLLSSYAGIDPLGKINRYERVAREYREVDCPDIISIYNKSMGGVELLDSLVAFYRNPIRSKKWYHRLLFHFNDMLVVQAWNIYRRDALLNGIPNKKVIKLRVFKMEIAVCLIQEKKSKVRSGRPSADVDDLQRAKVRKGGKGAIAVLPPRAVRVDQVGHFPESTGVRGKCKFPSCKLKSVSKCVKCDAYLCIKKNANCFMKFHQ